jgi:ubiquinone/menaquinone biosynthesis C-methylase UbiE
MRPSTKTIFQIISDSHTSDMYLLDVACGKGKETLSIRNKFQDLRIDAFDGESTNHFQVSDAINFKLGFIQDISHIFPEKKYDIILCQHIFEHIVYPDNDLKILKKHLKPNGIVVIESPNWTRLCIPFHKNYFWNDPTHIRPYTKKSFQALAKNTGLQVVSIETKSSVGLKDSIVVLFASKNPFIFIKRLIACFINPFLKDNIILVAKYNEV